MNRNLILLIVVCSIFILPIRINADIPRIARISNLAGIVEVQRAGLEKWTRAKLEMSLYISDKVRTLTGSMVEILLDDGSFIRLKEKSTLEIKEMGQDSDGKAKKSIFGLSRGSFWSKVSKLETKNSKFEVHTPGAVVGVRGTVLSVFVGDDMLTRVSVFAGRVEVQALRQEMGAEIGSVMLGPNQSASMQPGGKPKIEPLNNQDRMLWSRFDRDIKQSYSVEASIDRSMQQARAAITQNIKNADFELGKSLIDVHGMRVRLEQYILRPNPDQLQFLVLNTRESRFDYKNSSLTFNKNLPDDFSATVRDALKGSWVSMPEYYLEDMKTTFANHYGDKWNMEMGGGFLNGSSQSWWQSFQTQTHSIVNGDDPNNVIIKSVISNLHLPQDQWVWLVEGLAGLEPAPENNGEPYIDGYERYDPNLSVYELQAEYPSGKIENWIFWTIDDLGNITARGRQGNTEVKFTATEFSGRDIDVLYIPMTGMTGF